MSTFGRTLGVAGASGGLGASTLTVALSAAAARSGLVSVCVDADFAGGGLDVTAGIEHVPGLRWPDLYGLEGQADGARLLESLPSDGSSPVLSAGLQEGGYGGLPADAVMAAVLGSLGTAAELVVADLPRWSPACLVERCDAVVLLAALTAQGLADAEAVGARLGAQGCDDVWLVTRGPLRRMTLAERVAARLDVPLVGHLADSPQVPLDAERGRGPGERARGPLAEMCGRILSSVALPSGPSIREVAS